MIRHSASTVNRSSHPPGRAPFLVFPGGGDCFCLRYLLSDESSRIELTQKAMEMDFCVVFCDVVSPRLPFKLGEPGSILGRTSTQSLKIIEEKVLPLH